MIIGLVCAVVVIGIDQLTKLLVYGTAAKSIIGNFLWFESTLNTGVAFSMFEGQTVLFIVISAIAAAIFVYLLLSKKFFTNKFLKVCLGLILGGTVGNMVDRIVFSGVRDFIYFKFINFAIFNIADAAIVIAVFMICIYMLIDIF